VSGPPESHPHSELRVVVAGATKSGKSTLLNALVGIEVLPNRHVPTTCMPTRLELVDAAAQPDPVLLFDDDLVRCLSTLNRMLRTAQLGDDSIRLIDRHVHLAKLLTAVRSGAIPEVPGVTVGVGRIKDALEHANDLVRLAILARTPSIQSVLDSLEPPSVRVPFSDSLDTPVVVIDIPGPDEIGAVEELRRLVGRELKRADTAFLVLDFTRLETTAGLRSMCLVKDRPWLFIEGSAVIINRIDQRRADDRDRHALRRFVAHHIGRGDLPVLETAALHALTAAAYLGGDDTRYPYAARDLLGLCYPDALPDELAKLTPPRIRDLAVRQLELSGIRPLRRLVEILAADAHREAARAAAQSALVQLKAHQPAWSLQVAEHPSTLKGRER
jgi:GTPase SAR1 family protein